MRVANLAVATIISILGFVFFLSDSTIAISSSVPVELVVPKSTITVSGRASPSALITIDKNGSTIGTAIADSSGSFSTIISVDSGINDIEIHYNDINGRKSKTTNRSISVQNQQNTDVSVFLSPTLEKTGATDILKGSLVQLRGYTTPNSIVELSINYGQSSFSTNSDASGSYEFILDSNQLSTGDQRVVTRTKLGVDVSEFSSEIVFRIASDESPTTPDITVSPDDLSPPVVTQPPDGALIDENSVIIRGQSVPGAQINIYRDNILIGSTFANDLGEWQFEYTATYTPVTFAFEACVDERCSVFSNTIKLNFIEFEVCDAEFSLEKYRYWGVKAGDEIELKLTSEIADGLMTIDWGDKVEEIFNIDKNTGNTFKKVYSKKGTYNGQVKLVTNQCEINRYFSVSVIDSDRDSRLLWILLIIVLSLLLLDLARREKS